MEALNMKDKNTLGYVAQKYNAAVYFLAKSTLSRGMALADLFDKLGFSGFTEPGIYFKYVPEDCKENFNNLKTLLDKMHEDMFAEREAKTKIHPELKATYDLEINTRTALAKLDDETAAEIIKNICEISSVLECLKNN